MPPKDRGEPPADPTLTGGVLFRDEAGEIAAPAGHLAPQDLVVVQSGVSKLMSERGQLRIDGHLLARVWGQPDGLGGKGVIWHWIKLVIGNARESQHIRRSWERRVDCIQQ